MRSRGFAVSRHTPLRFVRAGGAYGICRRFARFGAFARGMKIQRLFDGQSAAAAGS